MVYTFPPLPDKYRKERNFSLLFLYHSIRTFLYPLYPHHSPRHFTLIYPASSLSMHSFALLLQNGHCHKRNRTDGYNTDLRQGRYSSPTSFALQKGKGADSGLPIFEEEDKRGVGNSVNRHKTLPLPSIHRINRESRHKIWRLSHSI